jgi:DNA replication and repair protein RecF
VSNKLKILSVKNIEAYNFRNYSNFTIDFNKQSSIILGRNGAGKTNILESLSLIMPGKGLRRVNYSDISNNQTSSPWKISAQIDSLYDLINLENIEINEKRQITINNSVIRNKNEVADLFCIIWLTPQMDYLFSLSNTEKRKFFDRLVYNYDSEHATRLLKYEYYIRERNKILKNYNKDYSWLSIIEKNISEIGTSIIATRLEAAIQFNRIIKNSDTAFPQAIISIIGDIEKQFDNMSALQVELYYQDMLKENRQKDAEQGRTSIGAHKSEIKVLHTQKSQYAEFCSTGEQKALLISLILANAKLRIEKTHTVPVMLLDEILVHLDFARQESLFNELNNLKCQFFITSVSDIDLLKNNKNMNYFEINDNNIKKIKKI